MLSITDSFKNFLLVMVDYNISPDTPTPWRQSENSWTHANAEHRQLFSAEGFVFKVHENMLQNS